MSADSTRRYCYEMCRATTWQPKGVRESSRSARLTEHTQDGRKFNAKQT